MTGPMIIEKAKSLYNDKKISDIPVQTWVTICKT